LCGPGADRETRKRGRNGMLRWGVTAGLMLCWCGAATAFELAYPTAYTLFQRDSATAGVVRVRGRVPSGRWPKRIEARLNGGDWRRVEAQGSAEAFEGRVMFPVGQGFLDVRGVGGAGHGLAARVACVGVGDVFVIAGQSNADGRGNQWARLDPANPYVGVKFRKGVWSEGSDPAANDGDTSGSPWPIVFNSVIQERKVPVGYINAAVGSTVVKQWRRGSGDPKKGGAGSMYVGMRERIRAATDGSMKFRAVLYHQGENDLTRHNGLSVQGDYTAYKDNLMAMVSEYGDDFKVPVLVGQITNLGGDRQKNDAIRQAQQEVWDEHPHALPGAVTYDIRPTDGVHYRDETGMRVYAGRWSAAILSGVYGREERASPKWVSLRKTGGRRLTITCDQPLAMAAWDGRAGTNAEGFRLMDGGQVWTGAKSVSAALDGKELVLTFADEVPASLRVSYGSGADGQGKVILRSAATGLPVPLLFGRALDGAGPSGE